MATALRPVGHEERLTLVGHLEELRTRLIICVAAIAVAFSVCYWPNDRVLEILNKPLETKEQTDSSKSGGDPLEQQARFSRLQKQAYETQARFLESLSAADLELTPGQARLRAQAVEAARAAAAGVPRDTASNPITLGVTEPFTQTISVALYAALLLALPLILYQVYAFLIPAFTPGERKVAVPIMLMVPFLFLAGLAFGYFVVLERAIAFLQNFNDDNFDILVQASTYYKFVILFLGAIGLLFQIPVAVLAVTRTGILSTKQLRKGRGYAILGIAVLAAVATPTPDPITMTLAMGPLILLYEASILLARWLDHVSPRVSRWDLDDDVDDDAEELDDDPEEISLDGSDDRGSRHDRED
jgi:sec-independent protein translocase protein TatC